MEQIKGLAGLGYGEKKNRNAPVGDSPQLIVDLDSQENHLLVEGKLRPYYREVAFSQDLLEGKRGNVLAAAVNYYYDQACRIAQGMLAAEAYRKSGKMKV